MKILSKVALAVAALLPSLASAQNFEALVIGNGAKNGSNFYMLSLRRDLGFGEKAAATATDRNASDGLRFRFDLGQSTYESNYDSTPGTGTSNIYRLLLSYGIALDEGTTLTVTGGVSHHENTVRPVTLNSPDDETKTGEFFAIDLEHSPTPLGSLQALVEHDGAGSDYMQGTFLFNTSTNWRIGPTANYVLQGDYSRTAYGLAVIYEMGDQFEIKATAAKAEQTIGSAPSSNVDYFELQLRSVF